MASSGVTKLRNKDLSVTHFVLVNTQLLFDDVKASSFNNIGLFYGNIKIPSGDIKLFYGNIKSLWQHGDPRWQYRETDVQWISIGFICQFRQQRKHCLRHRYFEDFCLNFFIFYIKTRCTFLFIKP